MVNVIETQVIHVSGSRIAYMDTRFVYPLYKPIFINRQELRAALAAFEAFDYRTNPDMSPGNLWELLTIHAVIVSASPIEHAKGDCDLATLARKIVEHS